MAATVNLLELLDAEKIAAEQVEVRKTLRDYRAILRMAEKRPILTGLTDVAQATALVTGSEFRLKALARAAAAVEFEATAAAWCEAAASGEPPCPTAAEDAAGDETPATGAA